MIRQTCKAVTYTRFSAATGRLCYWKAHTLASRALYQCWHRAPSRLSSVPGKGGHWLPPAHLQSEHYLGSPFSPSAFFILLIFFICYLTNKDTSKEGIEPLTILLLLNRNLEICLVREKNLLVEINLKDLASSFTTHEWIIKSQLLFGRGNWYVVFMAGCVDMCLWEFVLNILQVHRTSLGIYIYIYLAHIFVM